MDNARTGELDGMASRAVGADLGDNGQHDVLGGNTGRETAIDRYAHALGLALPQRLRHQHMGDLGSADAERVGSERAMRRGVAVAANDQ